MNKKFLSAVLFGALMIGSSVTFTGCIDNDEPAGIENLRGAKAELLRAKVAVEEANAAYRNAEAEKVKAEAEVQKAEAEIKKAKAEEQRLLNEYATLTNEQKKAEVEQEIAKIKQEMEVALLQHQEAMLRQQESLAKAQYAYERAMKQLEVAKALLTDYESAELTKLETAVETAQSKVNTAVKDVKAKEKTYAEAVRNSKVDSVDFKIQELEIERAKAAHVTAQENLAKWQDFMSKDVETADWRKEIAVLEDSIKGLERQQTELDIQKTKIENSDKYKSLQKAITDAQDALQNLKTEEKLTYAYKFAGELWSLPVQTIPAKTSVSNALTQIGGSKWDGKGGLINTIQNAIDSYTSEKKALLDIMAVSGPEDVETAKKKSDEAIKGWENAMADYKAIGSFDANAALSAVNKAYTTYQDEMEAAGKETDSNKRGKLETKAQQKFADAIVAYYNACAPAKIAFHNITLKVTINSKDKYVTKTAKQWLSDAESRDIYLVELTKYFEDDVTALWNVAKEKNDGEEGEAEEAPTRKAKAALSDMKDKEGLRESLVTASANAFGGAFLMTGEYPDDKLANLEDGYMRVKPTVEEMKKIDFVNCGAWGTYSALIDPDYVSEAKNYKDLLADYEKALTYWNNQLTALKNAYTKAETAVKTAQAAYDKFYVENIEAIDNKLAIIGDRIDALTNVKDKLARAVEDYIDGANYDSTKAFEDWLKAELEDAKDAVLAKEKAIVKAENKLIEMKEESYDKVAGAQEDLNEATATLAEAQEKLTKAIANLQTALEIMSKTADAE